MGRIAGVAVRTEELWKGGGRRRHIRPIYAGDNGWFKVVTSGRSVDYYWGLEGAALAALGRYTSLSLSFWVSFR